jgi:hypothetical protein
MTFQSANPPVCGVPRAICGVPGAPPVDGTPQPRESGDQEKGRPQNEPKRGFIAGTFADLFRRIGLRDEAGGSMPYTVQSHCDRCGSSDSFMIGNWKEHLGVVICRDSCQSIINVPLDTGRCPGCGRNVSSDECYTIVIPFLMEMDSSSYNRSLGQLVRGASRTL